MAVKPPKAGSNNNIEDFYKNMEESSNFKDYLIFFIQINEIQVKKYKTTYKLTDDNNDTILINAANNFVKFFKDFAAKHLENFKESNYDIFKENVYLSQLVYFFKMSKTVERLEVDNDIQNWARKIFKVDSNTHQRVVNSIKTKINQKTSKIATLSDFKRYLNQIEMDQYEHSLPEDYYTRDLYEMWKKMEKAQIVKYITSIQSNIVINSSNQKILSQNEYYYIPPEPYLAFKQLVELCMFKDCDSNFEGDDILSENSKNLIQECEFRWRIPKSFKDIIIIDILIQNYINNFIGINDITDFLQKFIDSIDKSDNIRIHEIEFLCSTFDGLIDKLMNEISHVFQYVKDIREVQPYILDNYSTIKLIYKSKLYKTYLLRNNIHTDLAKSICDNFKVATDVNYKNIELTIFNTQEEKPIINKLIFEYIKRMNISFQKLTYEPGYSDDLYKLVDMKLDEIKESEVFKEVTDITNPELFIKINNIYKTYNLLEKICENSEVPYYHSILVSQMKSTINNDIFNINDVSERYRISVIRIKDIPSNSAGFVSPFIEMNLGTNQLFRTNMKQKTVNPEFYEEFILKINENTSSVLDIKIKNGEGKEVTIIGQTKIMLRSILFEDGLIHNIEVPINPRGTLYLRISKLKVIDEIRYYILNISEYIDYTLEDCCTLIIKLVDHPAFKKYTLEENQKMQENDEAIAKRQQTRMRMATQRKMKATVKRVQTLMNIVKNQSEDTIPKLSRSATVKNDLLNEDLFKEFDYEHLPSHDFIRLIWDRIVEDLHALILQYYDIYGNSISEKGKLTTKFHNLLNTTMTSVAFNIPKNMNMNMNLMNNRVGNKMSNMFEGNFIFNQKSVSIINNILELLKSFFACEIDKTCYGFPKEELETDCYIELKNFIKLIKENNSYKKKTSY
ncbi:hypothetical protein PIROE2DRAFT_56736 [Piromyces sp. E2]|nr:hypothetical protein PIROE2DRAFT_56736 [Piromyces sp. E2]|eukprot:OUM70420.1 hypothetical protein PIROE2DRAFT_56736 [Piromyces sp. E2]